MRPDHGHERTDEYRRQRADDRNKARAAKKAQELRKCNLVKPMMERAGYQPNHHAAKDAGFQRLNTQRHALPHRTRVLMRQFAGEDQQRVDGGIHHQKREKRRQPRRALIAFCQPDGDPNRKQHREVRKHDGSCAAHDGENGLQPAHV
ncbi:Uncharacterised protein [Klebsiella pneumoniae]|nr:Uncharacterised protein [Klebsiella pneumoniae]